MNNHICEWCGEASIRSDRRTVYWELPDGTRAIEITDTPTKCCQSCKVDYQSEALIQELEDQLYLVDRSKISESLSFDELMSLPRLLKKNYFRLDS
ncbi:YokU family protein [Bacillus sp. 2205SS5-2]|uniref:YokU family protein n=1 Tax=Bacillus sp. 2205SS5-2 TaxID=3109031 RepID=UPI003007DD2B